MRLSCVLLATAFVASGSARAEQPEPQVEPPAPAAALDPAELDRALSVCSRRWPSYAERRHACIVDQLEARFRLLPLIEEAEGRADSPELQVVEVCRTRFGMDWVRLERCVGTQVSGYWTIHPNPPGFELDDAGAVAEAPAMPAAPAPPAE